jgi:prepilin-type N-terminal cleavage/methylation domain-containing protein
MIKRKGLVTAKRSEAGFTLVELLVVIAIIALLMGILLPALARARELGKRAVCLNQIKQLGVSWYMYCDDNKERVPVGDVYYSWAGYCQPHPASVANPAPAWHEYPHKLHSGPPTVATNGTTPPVYPVPAKGATPAEWRHAAEEGTMWKYIKDPKVLKCPVGDKGQEITYTMVHSMNTDDRSVPAGTPMVILRTDIKRTAESAIFLDFGAAKQGAFYIRYNGETSTNHRWSDLPPTRHGMGTNFVFADQHAEYKKWTDPHAVAATKYGWDGLNPNMPNPDDKCDCDLRWFFKVTWGSVTYKCTTKRCDY